MKVRYSDVVEKLRTYFDIENQKWLLYALLSSSTLIIILNSVYTGAHAIEKVPYSLKEGIIGVFLSFFGVLFFLELMGDRKMNYFILHLILSIILLYFGIGMLLG